MSLLVMVFVISPSRSRTRPAADGRSRAVTRVHEEFDGVGPAHDAAQQAELVAAHRHGGPGDDHRAPVGGNGEELLVLPPGASDGHDELGEPRADRQLERDGVDGDAPAFVDDEPAERTLARDDARSAAARCPPGSACGRRRTAIDDEHRGEQGEPEEGELDPAERAGERERRRRRPPARASRSSTRRPSRAPRTRPRRARRARSRSRAIERMPRASRTDRAECDARTARVSSWRARGSAVMPPGRPGGATSTRTRLTMSSAVTPANSDSGSTMMRCASTGHGELANVVGGHVGAAVRDRPRLHGAGEREGAAHADAERRVLVRARRRRRSR